MTTNITYSSEILGVTAAGVFLISIVGTLGNLLAVVALLQSTTLRQNPSTAFMVNMPACLLPICAIGMPLFGVGCLQRKLYGETYFTEAFIEASFSIGLILGQVHLHTICALAFNRLLAVMKPTMYKQLMQHRKVRVYLGLLWLYSVLLWLPLAFGAFGGLKYNRDELMVSMNDSQGRAWKGFHVFFTFMLPILFGCTCYIAMYVKVRHSRWSRETRASRKNMTTGEDDMASQWDDHVTRTILVIFVIMVLCCVPHLVIHIRHLHERHPAAWLLLHLVFWVQFCVDPVVYVTVSCKYRAACGETVNRLMKCLTVSRASGLAERSVPPRDEEKPKQIIHFNGKDLSQDPVV